MTTITISPPSAQGSKKVESAKKEESKEKLMVSNQRKRNVSDTFVKLYLLCRSRGQKAISFSTFICCSFFA